MKSIFNKNDNAELIERIKKLNSETQGLWGKMNVGQMLKHVRVPLQLMNGSKQIKFTLLGFFFGKTLMKKYFKDRGFGKNLPTHTEFRVVDKKEFESEQKELIHILQQFLEKGPSSVTKNKHPFFGHMSAEQWDDMMYLHLNHHLQQFGV